MDNYNEEIQEATRPVVKTSIMSNGRSIHFDAQGLHEYEVSKLHQELVEQVSQIRQQSRESQLIRLVAFGQLLLFLICGLMLYGQLQRTGGDAKQGQVQHQSRWANRV